MVKDLRCDDLHYYEKLGLRDKSRSVVEFEFQTYDTGAEDFPGYEYYLSLVMSSTPWRAHKGGAAQLGSSTADNLRKPVDPAGPRIPRAVRHGCCSRIF